jgi:hypothetical protein
MPDYSNGKIYAIRSHRTEEFYIGSTIQPLSVRIGGHKANYNTYIRTKKSCYCSSAEILKYNDFYIELLELYPCNSKDELCKREGELIRLNNCVNKAIPYRPETEKKRIYCKERYHKLNSNIIENVVSNDSIRLTVKGYTLTELIKMFGDNLTIEPND